LSTVKFNSDFYPTISVQLALSWYSNKCVQFSQS